MLKFLNNKFINSSKKIKIELYILPLLIFISLYFFIIQNIDDKKDDLSYKLNSFTQKNERFDGSFLELFSTLENLSKNNNITIFSSQRDENFINLKGLSKEKSILFFLKEIENINNFTKINSLLLNNKENAGDFLFDLNIDLNNFYIKNIPKIKNDKNINKLTNKEFEKKDLKINAIIADYAFINNIWVKKNEKINGLELIKIQRNFVVLKNENEEIKLELLNEEYLKKLD
ncbi:hypothetical protein [Arcobacter sp. L]|uniref:hypothetical protein n=1 Tax=Arcobacter sp. L TaxID=944547 RepID=UPI00022962F0|nr:hypothetical protein [Arcobacter sp. L]BAK74025.1 conserved hypothetical protein [Arcobacter sp. L]